MDISFVIKQIADLVLGWPLMIFVVAVSVACTIGFKFIQVRYFAYAWRVALAPASAGGKGEITPLQAFINTLSSNLGNGAIAGTAASIAVGGPGAAFWIIALSTILMAVRFAEVYLSTMYSSDEKTSGAVLGGPMLYLTKVLGGKYLAVAYAWLTLFFGFIAASGFQANSISLSFYKTWGVAPWISAAVLFAIVAYIVLGGAARIVKVSDRLVPVKVVVFVVAAGTVLIYHAGSLLPAIWLMIGSALTPSAMLGGALGFSIQQALRAGMQSAIFSTESGLGTAAIFFGFTGSKNAFDDAVLAMLSTFISAIVCFVVGLCIVASGVWSSGATSTALTIEAFNTVFGVYGGWIVTFLSTSFGLGVMIAYAYLTRMVWMYLSNGRFSYAFALCYALSASAGALMTGDVSSVWNLSNIVMAGMFAINLFGIAYLLPTIISTLKNR